MSRHLHWVLANMSQEDIQKAAANMAQNMSPEDLAIFANMVKGTKGPSVEEVN